MTDAPTVRCPMPECRRRVPLDDISALHPGEPCLHFVAAWAANVTPMAEAILHGLTGNREFLLRNFRPNELTPDRIEMHRATLEAVAQQFAHVVLVPTEEDEPPAHGALFADRHEANHVAREYAHHLLGADPVIGGRNI